MQGKCVPFLSLLAAFACLLNVAAAATPDPYQVLYNFAGGTADGRYPTGSLVQSGNTLYGVTEIGGASNAGAVFDYDLATGTESIVYSFTGGTGQGVGAIGPLFLSGNTLYGVTGNGGSVNDGTVYSLNPANDQETTLYSFMGGPTDGKAPEGPLIQVGSTIYGTTFYGGENGDGTIFSFNANSYNGVSISHSFSGTATDGVGYPQGNLVSVGSTIYGLSELGDDVFAYNTANNTVSPVAYFNGNDGADPMSLTESTQSSSIFYGMTVGGGSADAGALFELNLATDQITALHSFLSIPYDGFGPLGPVIQLGDMLYGETSSGGDAGGGGVIFSYDLDNSDYAILHEFGGQGGASPDGGLLLDGNTLYGITEGGGANGDEGVIFSYVLPEPGTFTLIAGVAGCGLLRRRR